MSTEHLARIAARLSDWDATEALHEMQREEYEREAIATAQSEAALAAMQQEYSNAIR